MTSEMFDEPLVQFDRRPLRLSDLPGPSAGPEGLEHFCQRIRGQYPLPRDVNWRSILERPDEWGLLALASCLFMLNRRRHWCFGEEQEFRDLDEFKQVRAVVRRMAELLAALDGREVPHPDEVWETADVDGMWNAWEAPLIAAAEAAQREYERLRSLPSSRRAEVDGLSVAAQVDWIHGGQDVRVMRDGCVVLKGRIDGDLLHPFLLGETTPEEFIAALRDRHLLASTG
jgi:hypothetical protein